MQKRGVKMKLTSEHYQAMELIIKGDSMQVVAKELGRSRATIYNWLDNEEFKHELDRRRDKLSNQAINKVKCRIDNYLEDIERIAKTSENDNTRLQAYNMLLDRALGKATAKQEIELSNTDNNADVDLDSLLEDKESNVIDLDKIAK